MRAVLSMCVVALSLVLGGCAEPLGEGSKEADPEVAVSSQALSTRPDQQCAVTVFGGHEYWFCRQNGVYVRTARG